MLEIDQTKEFPSLLYVEQYAKRSELSEKIVENNPRLQRPINGRLIMAILIVFLLLFPLLLVVPRNISFEEQVYDAASIYIPVILTITLFFINQKILIYRVFEKKKIGTYILYNFFLILVAILVRDALLVCIDALLSPENQTFFIGWTSPERAEKYGWVRLIVFVVMNISLCFVNLCIFAFGIQMQYFYKKHIRRQATLQAEFSFLKMQINQHFLFNTMNNIIAMMDIDSARAKKLMLSLSQILRTMLYETKSQTIPVSKEVDVLKDYAELEKLHFGGNFDFEFNVNLKNPNAKVVPMLLLPLVENVFKHSLNVKGRSFVKLSVEECDGVLTYRSENSNFPRETKRDDHHGVGLANLQKRLDTVYAGRYEYVSGVDGNAYKAYLKVTL